MIQLLNYLLKVFFMTLLKKCMSSYLKILNSFQDLRIHKPRRLFLAKSSKQKKWLESLLGIIVSLRNSIVNNNSYHCEVFLAELAS